MAQISYSLIWVDTDWDINIANGITLEKGREKGHITTIIDHSPVGEAKRVFIHTITQKNQQAMSRAAGDRLCGVITIA